MNRGDAAADDNRERDHEDYQHTDELAPHIDARLAPVLRRLAAAEEDGVGNDDNRCENRARDSRDPAGDDGERHGDEPERDERLELERLVPRARTRSATIALSPSIAARLNAFEPTTTPTATDRSCDTSAVIADEISGASAASAVSTPRIASGIPSRSPIRSRRLAKTAAAPSMSATRRERRGWRRRAS